MSFDDFLTILDHFGKSSRGGGVKVLDGLGKVSDGLKKARAFFKKISH